MQVAKWGNSLAVRLPTAVVEALSLREGDDIEIEVAGARAFEIPLAPADHPYTAASRCAHRSPRSTVAPTVPYYPLQCD
ncbi:MAG: AbrB/MazE/SpoVT family DNA-binding domain-containing protein [Candidatus Competibacter sp.]